ncbi:MAG: HlyD family secretion protein [Muribaculaceae bacterium]
MMKRTTKRIVYNIVIFALLFAGIAMVCHRFLHFGNVEYTDNATVCQHITPINTRVAGFIREIRFEENQKVKAGDTLVIIEDAEFRLLLAQAEAQLANARAGHSVTAAGIVTTASNIAVTEASIDEAKVQYENAQREYERYSQLLSAGAVTQQQYDNVHTSYLSAKARYERAARSKDATANAKNEQGKRLGQNDAAIKLCEANVNLARLNLSYCAIIATCDGVTGRKNIHVGQLVQAGQNMVDVVDSNDLWVQANYRESQIAHISVGSKVKITVDAVPGVEYVGTVESLADATGSAFSTMPSDNATGNFVKVEQRLPVRISLQGNEKSDLERLKAGYNVECEVLRQ